MAQLSCPSKRLTQNFPSDRVYTHQALVEELFLVERHIRDGSWHLCDCTPSKHLPGIAGLASEGYGFAHEKGERGFMECLMNQARLFKSDIETHKIRSQEQWDRVRDWARRARHLISARDWAGKESIEDQLDYSQNDLTEMVESLNALKLSSLPELEERNTWEAVKVLCKKYGVSPPKRISFTDSCNPLYPNAAHIQRDERTEDGLVPRPELDELVFCKGATSVYAIAHEVKHYIEHHNGVTQADEGEANEFALSETRNTLYTPHGVEVQTRNNLYTEPSVGKEYIHTTLNHTRTNDMAIDKKKGITIVVGLTTAKLVNKYLTPQLDTTLGTMAAIGKVAGGAALLWYGLKDGKDSMIKSLAAFAGAELVLTEVLKYLPGGTIVASAPVYASYSNAPIAIPMAPGGAVISAASQYSRMYQTPTRLTAGYPGVAQVDGKWVDQRV